MKFNHLLVLFVVSILALSCGDKGDDCVLTCQNGGILTIDCNCACPTGFEGTQCEVETCALDCQNGGTVTTDCACDCPSDYQGALCENCKPWLRFAETAGTIWDSGQNYVDDVEATLPANYVLTGFGFSENSTLMLAGREVFRDGTLGDEYQDRSGSNPNGTFDVAFTAPPGHVITGVGFGKNNNFDVTRLVVNYAEILFDSDCNISLGLPILYDNNDPFSVDAWLRILDTGLDSKYYAFRGLGIRYSSQPYQVEAAVGLLDNL